MNRKEQGREENLRGPAFIGIQNVAEPRVAVIRK
jgi:hypothetical protein